MIVIPLDVVNQLGLVAGMILTSFLFGCALSTMIMMRARRRDKLEETIDLLLEQVVTLSELLEKKGKRMGKRRRGVLEGLLEAMQAEQICKSPHCSKHGAWMYES